MKTNVEILREKRALLKTLRAEVTDLAVKVKSEKENQRALKEAMKVAKATDRAEKARLREVKKAERIAKLEAKLQALKVGKTGTAAKKAARKPGPVRTYDRKAAEQLMVA